MRSVYRFAIDGVDPEVLRKIFQEEITVNERRKMAAARVSVNLSFAGLFARVIIP